MALDTKRKHCFKRTFIFWDMVDFPVHEILDPIPSCYFTPIKQFYNTVKSSLYKYGFGSMMDIIGYDQSKSSDCYESDEWTVKLILLRKFSFCRQMDRFVRVSSAAIDMVRATNAPYDCASASPAYETNLMLIIKDVTGEEESGVSNVIRALLKEGYGITLVVPDNEGGIRSAYPYLTDDKDLSRIIIWNWSSLVKGDGPVSDDGNQGSSSQLLKMYSDDGNQVSSPKRLKMDG